MQGGDEQAEVAALVRLPGGNAACRSTRAGGTSIDAAATDAGRAAVPMT
jgi:hypothetical protein